MLQEEAEGTGEIAFVPDLKKIHTAGKHLLNLINDILDLSKIEAGKMEIHLESFSIGAVIEDVVSTIRPLVEKNANRLQVECPDDLGTMRADPTRVRQALLNLVTNGIKFTPPEGQVGVSARMAGDSLQIEVADTGIGIAKDDIPKALAPFGQIDSALSRRHAGTGLGLPLTKRLIEAHGASFSIESEFGAGTRVTIEFPPRRLVASSDLPAHHSAAAR